ncbi:diacylglycerol kinase [Sporichthya brevicatena]|uniref:Diacylglycerol kinase n=1 Tax=Sporichthya brevicatena TaxID=171442 RepID=A0ABN1GQI3_9ACTN
MIRVAQWGTGNVGSLALGAILDDSTLALVALKVGRPENVGRDAADLAKRRSGAGSTGVLATDDSSVVLAARPDCVLYMDHDRDRGPQVIDELCALLSRGVNVVATTMPMLVHPDGAGPEVRARLQEACVAGGSSFLCTGIEPGFTADVLVLQFASLCRDVRSVRVAEAMNVASYRTKWRSGLGNDIRSDGETYRPGHIARGWTGTMRLLADGLGLELDDVREVRHVAAAGREFEVAAGRYGPDDIAALHFEVQGIVAGEPRLVVEHTYRLLDDVGPEWTQPVDPGRRTTRIRIGGTPEVDVTMSLGGEGLDPTDQGVLGTAMRAVHAIPLVVAAAPGLRTNVDLPTRSQMPRQPKNVSA